MNCLLLPQKKAEPPRPTSLSQRLKGEPGPVETAGKIARGSQPLPPEPIAARKPVGRPAPIRREKVEDRKEALPFRYSLVLQQEGRHRITLPTDGEIVLGRFDPEANVTPDVDLSYEDQGSHVISRRHARIICHSNWHEIEDLGSTNGTEVNGERLIVGQKARLHLGDTVTLGYHEFIYEPILETQMSSYAPPPAYLWVTFTGHRFPLPLWGEVVIGRSDLTVGLVPDIDLSKEGDATQFIARRHARIIARGGRHYVEDLGSASGTKLNGTPVRIGELGLLDPGDHLWLGGCVLAYDIEPEPGKKRG